MTLPARAVGVVAVVVVGLLAAVPLAALGANAVFVPAHPITGEVPSLSTLWAQTDLLRLTLRSVVLAVGAAAVAVPVGTWLAWAEHRQRFAGSHLLTTLTILPLAMPSYVLAASVRQGLGISGLGAASVVIGVVTAPYVQLLAGAALTQGSASEEEAARTLGASPGAVFRDVVLPRIRPALGYSALLAMLYAISDFGAVAVLEAPVLTWRLYQAVQAQDLARAALLGAALVAATVPLLVVARTIAGDTLGARVPNPRRPPAVPAAWPSIALTVVAALLVVGIGVALPVTTLIGWVLEGMRRDLPFAALGQPVLHTVGIAALAGVAICTLALPPALVVGGRRRAGWLDPGVYSTSALPGVLLAFGWILAALWLARSFPGQGWYRWLTASGALLVLGYATRFVAEAYTPLRDRIAQLDRRLWESHRALSAPLSRFALRVAWPATASAVAASWLLVFLAVLKELPVTLMLGSATGLSTLAFRVWDRAEEALWHDAGAAGLILVGLALVGVMVSLPWRSRG
ncbi:MAG: ABC transporter permease subunit [Myxococcales bacterium]|nr:ABC transporter permease subunit [Myxococcales bacterium]